VLQFNNALLIGIGRPRTTFRIAIAGTILQVALFVVAVNFGIEAVAASYVVRAYLIAPVGLVIASRALGGALRPILTGAVPVAIGCVVMVLAVEATRTALGDAFPDILAVVVYGLVALPAYLLTMRLIAADRLAEAWRYARAAGADRLQLGRLLARA
jgi:PST family polysaccharide transporter